MRVIQISDTHLSAGKPHFADNWAPLADWIEEQRPDLVIHTGDVTVDGADTPQDMGYAAGLMSRLGVPFRECPAITMWVMPRIRASRSTTCGWPDGTTISARTAGWSMSRADA